MSCLTLVSEEHPFTFFILIFPNRVSQIVLAVLTALATCSTIALTEDRLHKMLDAAVAAARKDPTLSTHDIIEASLGATVATSIASSINEARCSEFADHT